MELVLELLNRAKKVQSHIKLEGKSLSIGRSYDNDLVVRDPHVSPRHMSISCEEDKIILTDHDSLNGIRDEKNKRLDVQTSIQPGQVFVIGNQPFRIRSSLETVGETLKLTQLDYLSHCINRWYWALITAALLVASAILNEYLGAYAKIEWPKLILESLLPFILVFSASFLTTITAMLLRKEIKFFSIFISFSIVAFVIMMLNELKDIIGFNFGSGGFYSAYHFATHFLPVGLAAWFAFYFASNLSMRRTLITASLVGLCFSSFLYAKRSAGDRVFTQPRDKNFVLPNAYVLRSPESHVDWTTNSTALFAQAIKEAEALNATAKE